jgi:hypothetical protein
MEFANVSTDITSLKIIFVIFVFILAKLVFKRIHYVSLAMNKITLSTMVTTSAFVNNFISQYMKIRK